MMLYLFIAYFVLNLVVAVSLHVHALRRTFEAPKPIEVVVYFLVMLVIGLPLVAVSKLVHHESGVED